jgi:hypothetical protein
VLSKAEWAAFEESHGWREVVDTVKLRMAAVNRDILNPSVCNNNEKRIQFQHEYLTCLWFINMPKIDVPEEEADEDRKDRTIAPDLQPFKL